MASKRDLKKQIRYVCSETALTLLFSKSIVKENQQADVDKLIVEVAKLQRLGLEHLNFIFDKQPKDFANRAEYRKALKAYNHKAYTSFINEFNKRLKEILEELSKLTKPEA